MSGRRHAAWFALVLALGGCQAIAGVSEKEVDPSLDAVAGATGTAGASGKAGGAGAGQAGAGAGGAGAGAGGAGAGGAGAGGAGAGGAGAGAGGAGATSGNSGSGGAGAAGTAGAGASGASGASGTAGVAGTSGASGAAGTGGGGGTTCTAGTATCNGATLEVCAGGQVIATPCAAPTPFCDAKQARCEPCLPGHVIKAGSTLSVCTSDGSAYVDTVCGSPLLADEWTGTCAPAPTIDKLSTGATHACAITTGGIIKCWGENGSGQLKDGTTTDRYAPVAPNVGTAIDVSAGFDHTCAVMTDGSVSCWGNSSNSQLGPTTVPFITGVTEVVAGFHFNCARKSDSTVWCWGRNNDGSLGDGTITNKLTPKQVAGLNDAVALYGDATVTTICARRQTGAVDCWGNDVLTPVQVSAAAEEAAVARPTGSSPGSTSEVVFLRKSDGSIDYVRRAGAGFGAPVMLTTSPFASMDGGDGLCAVRADGSVACATMTGTNPGPLTDDPVLVAGTSKRVGVGNGYRCVVTTAGNVACQGVNDRGQIGNDKPPIRAVPELVRGVGVAESLTLGLGSGWAVLPGGIVRGWGGASAFSTVDVPFAVESTLVGSDVDRLWLGAGLAYVRRRDGALHFFDTGTLSLTGRLANAGKPFVEAWPRADRDLGVTSAGELFFFSVGTAGNNEGIFGVGTTGTAASVLSQVPLPPVAGVAYELDGSGTNQHMCAWLADKSMRCWGRAVEGQTGTGMAGVGAKITNPTEPAFVGGAPPIAQVVVGGLHTCALDTQGDVYCWGANVDKQLGFNGGNTPAPAKVAGLGGAVGLAAGKSHTCAWYADGTARCWGKNTTGQCGDPTTTLPILPKVVAGLADVRSLVARDEHTCAIHHDGRVSCWGSAIGSRLGNGTLSSYPSPQFVVGL